MNVDYFIVNLLHNKSTDSIAHGDTAWLDHLITIISKFKQLGKLF